MVNFKSNTQVVVLPFHLILKELFGAFALPTARLRLPPSQDILHHQELWPNLLRQRQSSQHRPCILVLYPPFKHSTGTRVTQEQEELAIKQEAHKTTQTQDRSSSASFSSSSCKSHNTTTPEVTKGTGVFFSNSEEVLTHGSDGMCVEDCLHVKEELRGTWLQA